MPKQDGTAVAVRPPAPVQQTFTQPEVNTDDWFVSLDETVDYVNAVFYGREGSGKTTAACRMANVGEGKVLVINAEAGLKIGALRKRGVDVTKIQQFPNPGSPVEMSHANLDKVYHRVKADLARDPGSWTGVVIDSATEIHQALLDNAQKKRVNALQRRGQDADPDFVDIADYGVMSKLFRDLLRKFRDLPCHVVITALERRTVDKDTSKPTYGPAVTPGLQTDLLGYVDFVLMFKAADEDGPYRALTRANSRYRAKDRYDVLPKVLAEPMFDRLIGYRDGDLEDGSDPFQDDLPAKVRSGKDTTEKAEVDSSEADSSDSTD